jgi:hypothetical protein
MVRVRSETIAAIGYEGAKRWLDVRFVRGHTYRYLNVPPEMHRGLMDATSKGQYFNEEIRGAFLYTMVDSSS